MNWFYVRLSLVCAILASAASLSLLAAATEPAAPSAPGSEAWIRRLGRLAKVSPGHVEEFRRRARADAPYLRRARTAHHLRTEHVFLQKLVPNAFYAFRFQEYDGQQLADDFEKLHEDKTYAAWLKQLDACLATPWTDLEEVFYTAGRESSRENAPKVFGQVVGLRPEMIEAYRLLHAHPWPGVLAKIREGNIRNYSIFLAGAEQKQFLFAYFEYVGSDFDTDMTRIDSDPVTQAWMKFTDDACQLPLETRKAGEWWATMEQLSSTTPAGPDYAD